MVFSPYKIQLQMNYMICFSESFEYFQSTIFTPLDGNNGRAVCLLFKTNFWLGMELNKDHLVCFYI